MCLKNCKISIIIRFKNVCHCHINHSIFAYFRFELTGRPVLSFSTNTMGSTNLYQCLRNTFYIC